MYLHNTNHLCLLWCSRGIFLRKASLKIIHNRISRYAWVLYATKLYSSVGYVLLLPYTQNNIYCAYEIIDCSSSTSSCLKKLWSTRTVFAKWIVFLRPSNVACEWKHRKTLRGYLHLCVVILLMQTHIMIDRFLTWDCLQQSSNNVIILYICNGSTINMSFFASKIF